VGLLDLGRDRLEREKRLDALATWYDIHGERSPGGGTSRDPKPHAKEPPAFRRGKGFPVRAEAHEKPDPQATVSIGDVDLRVREPLAFLGIHRDHLEACGEPQARLDAVERSLVSGDDVDDEVLSGTRFSGGDGDEAT
jgi:hypothetical protein